MAGLRCEQVAGAFSALTPTVLGHINVVGIEDMLKNNPEMRYTARRGVKKFEGRGSAKMAVASGDHGLPCRSRSAERHLGRRSSGESPRPVPFALGCSRIGKRRWTPRQGHAAHGLAQVSNATEVYNEIKIIRW